MFGSPHRSTEYFVFSVCFARLTCLFLDGHRAKKPHICSLVRLDFFQDPPDIGVPTYDSVRFRFLLKCRNRDTIVFEVVLAPFLSLIR